MKNKLFLFVFLISIFLYACGSSPKNDVSLGKTQNTINNITTKENNIKEISEIELDDLQQLYINFDSSLSYLDAIKYITSTNLPYSEEKYNGSREIQVAFTDECTKQKYKEEIGDYVTIIYVYPNDENSSNDELEKYTFGTCCYIPADSSLALIQHENGSYFSIHEPGNYISKLRSQLELDLSISKEEQMLYYFNNK